VKHAKGRGSKFVYDTHNREILSLALQPGTPLDETGLSERFAMSRSPVREALVRLSACPPVRLSACPPVRLSAEGLVFMLSNRSTLVAPINFTEFPRYIEVLDFLQRINTRLAAQNQSDHEIERMEKQAKVFDQACIANDYLSMSASNRDFHMTSAAAGKNVYMVRAYGQLLDEGRRILHMHFDYIQDSATDTLLAGVGTYGHDQRHSRPICFAGGLSDARTYPAIPQTFRGFPECPLHR